MGLRDVGELCAPWCVRVMATLRIAEHVAAGVTEVGRLAEVSGCDRDALHNILSYLVDFGVFEEPEPGTFALNGPARELLDPSNRLYYDLSGVGGRFADAWGTLFTYARTGRSGYPERFGLPFWEDLDAHPEIGASFDALMGPDGHGTPDPHFDLTGGWESVHSVVDVGGGTGAMLAELLRLRPHLHGTLVDLPRTVERAAETFETSGVATRVTRVGQSFFDPLPAGADLYMLRKILSDWPDDDLERILARCAEAARPAGRVVVMDGVSPGSRAGGLSIEVMLLGGRHRTLDEFREVARRGGLQVQAAGLQPTGFIVECQPE